MTHPLELHDPRRVVLDPIPRAVNNLAVQALIAAFLDNKTIVDESSARTAIAEVTAD